MNMQLCRRVFRGLIYSLGMMLAALSALAQTPPASSATLNTSSSSTKTASPPIYIAPKGTGLITGRVTYEGGQPAAGIIVVANMQNNAYLNLTMPYMAQHGGTIRDKTGKIIGTSYEGPPPPGSEEVVTVFAATAADGTYRLSGVTSAPYNIFAAPHGTTRNTFLQKPWDWVAPANEGIVAQEGNSVAVPDLVLTHGALLQGRVVEAATGRPLQGIIVKAHGPERPTSSGETLTTVTNKDGRYTLHVAPGKSELGIDGVRLANGGEHDWSMKIDNALWSLDNRFETAVDGSAPEQKKSPIETASVETQAGQTHQITFRLRRGKLQYKLQARQRM